MAKDKVWDGTRWLEFDARNADMLGGLPADRYATNDSIRIKDPVRVSAAGNVALTNDIQTGINYTIDDVALNQGERVLVKEQTDAVQNGIYTVELTPIPGSAETAELVIAAAPTTDGDVTVTLDGVGTLIPVTTVGVIEVASLQVLAAPGTSGNIVLGTDDGTGVRIETLIPVTAGQGESVSLSIDAAPTSAGNVTVSLDDGTGALVGYTFAVDPTVETTATTVADKIRTGLFNGWAAGGEAGTNIVVFTANSLGDKTDATYNAGTTGATGTVTVTASIPSDTAISVADKIRNTTFAGWATSGDAGTDTVIFTADAIGDRLSITFEDRDYTDVQVNILVTTNGSGVDTVDSVASKIRNTIFDGWMTGGTLATVTFTALSNGDKTDAVFSGGTTGVTGTMTTTAHGISDEISATYTRAADFDQGTDVEQGCIVFVKEGTVNGGRGFILKTPNPITPGITEMVFVELYGFMSIEDKETIDNTAQEISFMKSYQTLRVANWNIYGGRHQDGTYIDLTANSRNILIQGSYDVVGLQELRVNFSGSHANSTDPINAIASPLVPFRQFYKSMALPEEPTADYGIGLLDGEGTIHHTQYSLPIGTGEEPRILSHAEMYVNGKKVHVMNTHVAFEPDVTRANQLAFIRDHLTSLGNETFILFGDFNVKSRDEFATYFSNWKVANGKDGVWFETYNNASYVGEKAIDNIICSNDITISDVGVHVTVMSDHNVLKAKLEVPY